jgi:uroporphyrinogen decarboxylase
MNGPMISLPIPRPDIDRFLRVLRGDLRTPYVPLIEYIVDDVVTKPVLGDLLGRVWVDRPAPGVTDRKRLGVYLDNFIAFWHGMGYDFVRFEEMLPLPRRLQIAPDAAPGSAKEREWTDSSHGTITSWHDFERYPWPKVEEFDFFPFEYLNAHLPEGMGLISCHGGGVFEHLSWIMSVEGLSYALAEDPALVRAVADRLGELMLGFYRHLVQLDRLAVVFPGDDMGYRTATIISPAKLREYTLPWHRRFAALAHEHGLPYFLHSCGNLAAIMPDLIDQVGIDGKHSFEDAIIPVQEFQKTYGDSIAVLGGLDLNILSGGTPEQVRTQTRLLLETCGARGRYALGAGNSVPSYVPVVNYLTMLDERNVYHHDMGVTS